MSYWKEEKRFSPSADLDLEEVIGRSGGKLGWYALELNKLTDAERATGR